MRRTKIGIILAGVAGLACSAALGDEIDQTIGRGYPKKSLGDRKDGSGRRIDSGTFGDRAINVYVYNNAANSFIHNATTLGFCSHILEDISLANGPYGPGFAGTRTLTGFQYGYGLTGSSATWDMRFAFYRPSQVNWAGFAGSGTGMIDPGATAYATITVTGFTPATTCPGFVVRSALANFATPIEMPAGDSELYLEAAILEPGTPGTAPLTSTNLFQTNIAVSRVLFYMANDTGAPLNPLPNPPTEFPANSNHTPAALAIAGNPATPGYSNPAYGRDSDFDASFRGQSLAHAAAGTALPTPELRYLNFVAAGNTESVSYVFSLQGSVDSPPPIAATSLNSGGFLPDGITQIAGTLTTANQFRAYKFNTKFDISYAETTFMDIDTEGSDQPVAFAVYTPDSQLFDAAEGRGDGPTSPRPDPSNAHQLSYGVARRPGVGAGEQYSGQEGVVPIGEYYVVVALATSGFGDGWAFSTVDPAGTVNFALNFNNNNQKTIPAGPAVSPALQAGADLGILTGGTQATPEITVRANGAEFARFSLTNALPTTGQLNQSDQSALTDVTFMDITQPGSSVAGEWNLALYNNNGFLASANSISYAGAGFNNNNGGGDGAFGCGGSFAQLSYGTAPSRGQTPLDPTQTTLGNPLNNQNGGALAGDQYYLCATMGTAFFANERWGARSTRGSELEAVISVTSDNRGPSGLCPADFNGDGGVDDVDFVYFAKYYNDLINIAGDLNFDTLTDDSDFAIFAVAYDALICF